MSKWITLSVNISRSYLKGWQIYWWELLGVEARTWKKEEREG